MPIQWVVLFGVQWLAVFALAVLVLGLSRRLTVVTAGAASAAGPDLFVDVPPIGTRVPHERELLAPAHERGRTAVVFFGSDCGPCQVLSQSLASAMADSNGGGMLEPGDELVIVTDPGGLDAFGHIGRVVVERDAELRRALGVRGTPMGFGVAQDGTLLAASLLNEVDDVVQLVSVEAQSTRATI